MQQLLLRLLSICCAPLSENKMSGGFQIQPDPHIYLAEDALGKGQGYRQLEQPLTHELIHAYDLCRAHVRMDNLVHHACTEIRASALSGECNFDQEVNRGNIGVVSGSVASHHQECVRRRAELSVAMAHSLGTSADGKDKLEARKAVDAAFERCYYDTAPFRRIPP